MDGFSWPPTQDDLDALNVVAIDGRPEPSPPAIAAQPERLRVIRQWFARRPRHEHRRRPAFTAIGRLALLVAGILIGLGLPIVFRARPDAPAPASSVTAPAATAPSTPPAPASGAIPSTSASVPSGGATALPGADTTPVPLDSPAATRTRPPRTGGDASGRDASPRRRSTEVVAGTEANVTQTPPAGRRDDPSLPVRTPPAGTGSPETPAALAERSRGTADPAARGESGAAAPVIGTDGSPSRPSVPRAQGSISEVLDRYESAYSRLDVSAAQRVWPSVDARALDRAFSSLRAQRLAFGACEVSVSGSEATARCPGSLRYTPRIGSDTSRIRNGRWTMRLSRTPEGWTITSVDVR